MATNLTPHRPRQFQGGALAPSNATVVRPADFSGLQQVSRVLGQQAGRLEAVQRQTDQLRIGKAVAETRLQWMEAFDAAKSAAPAGAAGFYEQFNAEIDRRRDELVSGEERHETAMMLDERLTRLQGVFAERALLFQADAGVAQRRQYAADFVRDSANAVLNDPSQYGQIQSDAIQFWDELDVPANERVKLKSDFEVELAQAMANGLLDRDPRTGVDALRRADGFAGQLDPSERMRLIDRGEREMDRLQREQERALDKRRAEARANLQGRLSDELAMRANGEKITDMASDDEIVFAYGDDAATFVDDLERRRVAADQLGAVRGAPPAALAAMLDAARPVAGKAGYAKDLANFEALQNAIAADEKARLQSPAVYAAQTSEAVSAAFEAARTGAGSLKEAINLSIEQQAMLGIPAEQRQALDAQTLGAVARDLSAAGDPLARLDRLAAIYQEMPDYSLQERLLEDLVELNAVRPGEQFAVEQLLAGNRQAALRISSGLQNEVSPRTTDEKNNIANKVASERQRLADKALALQSLWTGSSAHVSRAAQERDLMARLATPSVVAGASVRDAVQQAGRDLFGRRRVIADDNLGAVFLGPEAADIDIDELEDAMWRTRQSIDQIIDQKALKKMIDPANEGHGVSDRVARDILEAWRTDARWINTGDGLSLLVPIVDQSGGLVMQQLAGSDGKPITYTPENLIAVAPIIQDPLEGPY